MKICVIKPTALGDVAQACLVVPAVKERHPDWHLSWVVDEDYAELLQCSPAVDDILRFPRKRWRRFPNPFEILKWSRQLREAKFDIVLDLQGLARSGWMTWSTGAPRRIGLASAREGARLAYNEVVQDDALHAVERYRQAGQTVSGEFSFSKNYALQPPSPLPHPRLEPGRYTVLHPYSAWVNKMWPWERYSRLANLFPEETFVLVGRGEPFPVLADNVVDLRNETTVGQLISVLAHAQVVVSTDSGPAHVAAAFDRPMVALFGASDLAKTAPQASRVEILTSDIPCRPCLKRCCRNALTTECLWNISVEDVASAWRKLLS